MNHSKIDQGLILPEYNQKWDPNLSYCIAYKLYSQIVGQESLNISTSPFAISAKRLNLSAAEIKPRNPFHASLRFKSKNAEICGGKVQKLVST